MVSGIHITCSAHLSCSPVHLFTCLSITSYFVLSLSVSPLAIGTLTHPVLLPKASAHQPFCHFIILYHCLGLQSSLHSDPLITYK